MKKDQKPEKGKKNEKKTVKVKISKMKSLSTRRGKVKENLDKKKYRKRRQH